jgi:hypothetical protein
MTKYNLLYILLLQRLKTIVFHFYEEYNFIKIIVSFNDIYVLVLTLWSDSLSIINFSTKYIYVSFFSKVRYNRPCFSIPSLRTGYMPGFTIVASFDWSIITELSTKISPVHVKIKRWFLNLLLLVKHLFLIFKGVFNFIKFKRIHSDNIWKIR